MATITANTGRGCVAMLGIGAYRPSRVVTNSVVPLEKVGAVVLSTLSWKSTIPHGAPPIAFDLGINGVAAVDLASGCCGFVYGLGLAADMVRSGSTEYVLPSASRRCRSPSTRPTTTPPSSSATVSARSSPDRARRTASPPPSGAATARTARPSARAGTSSSTWTGRRRCRRSTRPRRPSTAWSSP